MNSSTQRGTPVPTASASVASTAVAATPRQQKGFTLVELMTTVLVISILAAIAVPSYTNSVRKSRRTEARTALLDAASREERFFATNNFYSVAAVDLGYTALPTNVGSNYYSLTVVCKTKDKSGNCSGYTLTASAILTQLKDVACATLTLDNTGLQDATGTDPTPGTTCWN
jgi:type IV pilus assembly protein PilE